MVYDPYFHLDPLSKMESTRPDTSTLSMTVSTRPDAPTLSMPESTKPDAPSFNLMNVAVAACILLIIILSVVIFLSCLLYYKCRFKKKYYSHNFNGSSPLALNNEEIELNKKVTPEENSGSVHEEKKGKNVYLL